MNDIKAINTNNNAALTRLTDRTMGLQDMISALEQQSKEIQDRMKELEEAGLIYASPHWRAGRYFMLVYPQKDGVRPSPKYIGTDEAKIQEAMEGIERATEYDRLAAICRKHSEMLGEAEYILAGFVRKLTGKFE